MIPAALDSAELNIAPDTFPPESCVKTTQLATVVGSAPRATIPTIRPGSTNPRSGIEVSAKNTGLTTQIRIWAVRCRRQPERPRSRLSVGTVNPRMRNCTTTIVLVVAEPGLRLRPARGARKPSATTATIPRRNQLRFRESTNERGRRVTAAAARVAFCCIARECAGFSRVASRPRCSGHRRLLFGAVRGP